MEKFERPTERAVLAERAWSERSYKKAWREGWTLEIDAGGALGIARYDLNSPLKFDTDRAALVHVATRALAGSRLHVLALYLDGRKPGELVDVPIGLLRGRG